MIAGLTATAQTAFANLILAGGDPISHVVPHALSEDGASFWHYVTNHMFMMVLSGIVLLLVATLAARQKSLVPTGFRNFLESILQFIREEVARPALGKDTDTFIPFLWTMFFLILTANLLGMIPLTDIGMLATQNPHLHIGGTATGNFGITVGLAIAALLLFHLAGVKKLGFGHYAKHLLLGHGPWWLAPLFIPIELMGAVVKPFALAIRLFANMTGGHIVVAVLLGFAVTGIESAMGGSWGMLGVTAAAGLGAVAINLLELFVAFLQAYIFTFLTALFLGAAIHPEH